MTASPALILLACLLTQLRYCNDTTGYFPLLRNSFELTASPAESNRLLRRRSIGEVTSSPARYSYDTTHHFPVLCNSPFKLLTQYTGVESNRLDRRRSIGAKWEGDCLARPLTLLSRLSRNSSDTPTIQPATFHSRKINFNFKESH